MLQLLGSEMKPRVEIVLLGKKKKIVLCLCYVKLSDQTRRTRKEYHVLTFFTPGCAMEFNSEMGTTVWCFRLNRTWGLQQDWKTSSVIAILVPFFPCAG